MNTKLTLTIEQQIIDKAKKYAKAKGRSLSDIIENYLKIITDDTITHTKIDAPITASLRGVFKAPKDFNYKKVLQEELTKKHLK